MGAVYRAHASRTTSLSAAKLTVASTRQGVCYQAKTWNLASTLRRGPYACQGL